MKQKKIIEQARENIIKGNCGVYTEERLAKESLRLCIQEINQMAMVNATSPLQKYLYIKKKQLQDFKKQEGIE